MKTGIFAEVLSALMLLVVPALSFAGGDGIFVFASYDQLGVALAMTVMPGLNNRARGLIGAPLADASNSVEILNELKRTFQAFKEENDAALKGLDNRFADVVQTEKVERINAEITSLQNALDETNRMLEALNVGGSGSGPGDPAIREHADAFNRYFRRGAENGLHELEVSAQLTTQSDPDGGYVVPTETEGTIDRVLGTVSAVRSLARVMNVSTGEYKKLVNVGGAKSGWVGEEQSRDETDTPKLRELLFTIMEIYANPWTTQTILDDASIDIAAWLADEVVTEFAEQEALAFVSGDGNKKPRGLLGYQTVKNDNYSVAGSWGKLGHVVTGKADGFAGTAPADALIDLYYALKQGYRSGATWLMSDRVMGTVRKMKDADGNYLWAPPTGADMPATILQKPVATDDNMPGLKANSLPIAFGDFKRGYLILDRIGIRVLRDPLTQKGKIGFYTTKRVGGGVSNFEAIKLLKCST
ncbi:phage major capsid protein, HK97 family [Roseibium sp. TrichSKD4]|uniref:phage major capsid protein n=1 Tax=Roseibium sp. TrichSKD4 TaxID=744980 RepID=UPI0001E56B86|nr:phage major capsid protein [Roseibium sp. TrichSKD4]EFO32611.1 phage major capsid protein, HK97 family [Roseibium sp. TrichSKD4]